MLLDIQNIEIIDNLKDSLYQKILKFRDQTQTVKDNNQPQIKLGFSIVRPNPFDSHQKIEATEEYKIHFSSLPFNIFLSQKSYEFISHFFLTENFLSLSQEMSDDDYDDEIGKVDENENDDDDDDDEDGVMEREGGKVKSKGKKKGVKVKGKKKKKVGRKGSFLNLKNNKENIEIDQKIIESNDHIYFQSLVIDPIHVFVSFNFHFFEIKKVNLQFPLIRKYGITGINSVYQMIFNEYSNYLKTKPMVLKFISKIPGIDSLLNIGSGVKNLIYLPIEGFRAGDGLTKGLRVGVFSLLSTLNKEAIKIKKSIEIGTVELVKNQFYTKKKKCKVGKRRRGHKEGKKHKKKDRTGSKKK